MLRDWLELIRVPNVFTAMADVAMGFFLVAPVAPFDARAALTLGLLVAASSLLYSAGMALNDVCDYEEDCRLRPGRPLPSGRVSRRAAARLGWGLLIGGVGVAAGASLVTGSGGPAIVGTGLAAWIVMYDRSTKRTLLGPIVLGACRMLNVILGMTATVDRIPEACIPIVVIIGLYVVGVSVLARGEAEGGRRTPVLVGLVLMAAAVGVLWWLPEWWEILVPERWWRTIVAFLTLLVVWRCWPAVVDPSPANVGQTVGQSLRALVVLDALLTAAVAGFTPGVAVLLLLVPNIVLSRWFYAT